MANITYNLQRWIRELEEIASNDAVTRTAFVNMVKRFKPRAHDILWERAKTGITLTQEYDIPEFREPLKEAIYKDATIELRYRNGLDSIIVIIDLDKTAGNISQYADAVESTRSRFSTNPTDKIRASWFWKNFIYGQAREGFAIRVKRTGKPGARSLQRETGTNMYHATISDRLSQMGTLAPYWSLIDQGNTSVPELDGGGFPYPAFGGTGFVFSARTQIEQEAWTEFQAELEKLNVDLELQNYGENGILDIITEAIAQFRESAGIWQPGEILQRLMRGNREYILYITRTSKLGIKLSR